MKQGYELLQEGIRLARLMRVTKLLFEKIDDILTKAKITAILKKGISTCSN